MRCFFHLVNDAETIPDDAGVDVPDLESAQTWALDVIGDLRREAGEKPEEWGGWRMNIVCVEGNVLASVSLSAPFF